MIKGSCVFCHKPFTNRHQTKYCSFKCQHLDQRTIYINNWIAGKNSGMIGIKTRVTSAHIRNYLIASLGEKCSQCGWDKRNVKTNKVPLEVDHIDGNPENNTRQNLRLLCPNCHSLTPFFRNLNAGKGRKWRTDKYRKNDSM